MVNLALIDLDRVIAQSELIASIKSLSDRTTKSRLFGDVVRLLTEEEIKALTTQGNHADDWGNIFVYEKFRSDHIVNNIFSGRCVLGVFDGKPSTIDPAQALPSGIYNSAVNSSEIGNGCRIWAASIYNYLVKDTTVVSSVGSLACNATTSFGNGRTIAVGNETGGREILSCAEMTLPLAEAVAGRRSDFEFLRTYEQCLAAYTNGCALDKGVIESGCMIRNTATIENAYIGKNALIDSALLLSDCTIMSSLEERAEISHGAMVRNSCVQWGCRVSSMAIVDESVLLEHSVVERHGKVSSSIIGPNTHIAEGEVTACLVGPFVGFHHQALLIAALWPEGKGNVGYGANVGSNHSGKAPDQEIWCGEGTFFGLGVNIKFPSDFSKAPYSIFATGITTAPQRLEFPFSLINTPSENVLNIPPGFNEISPGWVLRENSYMIKRNESKFRMRNAARRTPFTFEVFRSEMIDIMLHARNSLKNISKSNDFYTSSEIPGLGKNFMADANRKKGIETYTLFIEYYCLCGLFARVSQNAGKKQADLSASLLSAAPDDAGWEHIRSVLVSEGFAQRGIIDNLRRLMVLEEQMARSMQRSKEKDDIRGAATIPDYVQTHTPAADDVFIKETWENAATRKIVIETMVSKMEQ
jgi:carbonic anhydrase/acetyltransferase-like protein (isoleucine patch superfamily)